MNERIRELAAQAGFEQIVGVYKDGTRTVKVSNPELLERFAALVAAAEREACAKVCDELADDEAGDSYEAMCYCAYKIRARGEA